VLVKVAQISSSGLSDEQRSDIRKQVCQNPAAGPLHELGQRLTVDSIKSRRREQQQQYLIVTVEVVYATLRFLLDLVLEKEFISDFGNR